MQRLARWNVVGGDRKTKQAEAVGAMSARLSQSLAREKDVQYVCMDVSTRGEEEAVQYLAATE